MMDKSSPLYERGEEMRRLVHGDARIDELVAVTSSFDAPFEDVAVNAYAAVWGRTDALSLKLRTLVTVAMLSAIGEQDELRAHIRGALRSGWSKDELLEALAHALLYAGAARGSKAMFSALEVFEAWDEAGEQPVGEGE